MIRPSRPDAGAILRDGQAIDRAIVAAHRRTIRRHRLLNIPLAVWKEGRVVELSPSEAVLADDDDPTALPGRD